MPVGITNTPLAISVMPRAALQLRNVLTSETAWDMGLMEDNSLAPGCDGNEEV